MRATICCRPGEPRSLLISSALPSHLPCLTSPLLSSSSPATDPPRTNQSPVFSDASTHSTTQTLTLVDPDIETAPTVRLFLSLTTTGSLGPSFTPSSAVTFSDPNTATLLPLIAFLRKYEAHRVLAAALSCIDKLVSARKMTAYAGLVLGAAADSPQTCVTALSMPVERFPKFGSDDDPIHEPGRYRSTVNPRGMPYDVWREMPVQYSWALTRAWVPGLEEGMSRDMRSGLSASCALRRRTMGSASSAQG